MALELRRLATIRVARGPIVLDPLVVTGGSIITGSGGDFLVRFDKHTCKELWRKRKRLWLRSGHGDAILLSDEKTDTTQLWNEDGDVLWKRPGHETAQGDRLFVNAGGRLTIIDVLTGKTIDEFDCPPGRTRFFHDGILLLSNPDGGSDPLQAVDIARRKAVWRDSLVPKIQQTFGDPCPYGLFFVASLPGQAVVRTEAHLVAVSLADGSIGWGLPISMPHIAPLARDGRLYVWSEAGGDRLVIVDEATGGVVVNRSLSGSGPAFERGQPVYGGRLCRNHVVFTSTKGLMAVFRLADGELVWHEEYPAHFMSPVVEDNRVYVATADGEIVIFEAHGGEL